MNKPRAKSKEDLWKDLEELAARNSAAHHAFLAMGLVMDREYVLLALVVALCRQNEELATYVTELMAEVPPLSFDQLFKQVLERS